MKWKSPDEGLQLPAVTGGWLEQSKKIKDEILLCEKMNDTAYFNQRTLSDESKDGWLEEVEVESKKINNEILSYEKMNDTAYFNQSMFSDESKDGWLEESKKINNAIQLYEKMNDTAYFNQSTLSNESKDESNALLSDSKESEDAIFNESFRFRRGIRDESTDESEDPSDTLSGDKEGGSESFEFALESHNPPNESNINRVMDDFKSEVMGELLEIRRELKKKDDMNFHELLEIKREMKKKDNIILDLLDCLDPNQRQQNNANQGQQNGQIRQSNSPQDTHMGQQTVHTNKNKNVNQEQSNLPVS